MRRKLKKPNKTQKSPIKLNKLADVLAMDNSNVGAATRLFCEFSLK
jgi:hypothetical protein